MSTFVDIVLCVKVLSKFCRDIHVPQAGSGGPGPRPYVKQAGSGGPGPLGKPIIYIYIYIYIHI